VHRPDFEQRFEEAGVTGVFLVFEPHTGSFLTNDAERARAAFIPASTYKIFNSLVALETGVLADEQSIIPWDGTDRGWSKWNQDHDLRSAIKYSAVWFYQEVARRIGAERMQHYVDAADYGNREISGGIDLFWLEGGLRISPYEQIRFLRRLHDGDLPFSQRTMDTVKDILIFEETETYTLRAKTGWGAHSTPQVGWFVGYVERESEPLFFALNLDIVENEDSEARIVICRRILGDLGALNDEEPLAPR
jgi:beta-lactamase class D